MRPARESTARPPLPASLVMGMPRDGYPASIFDHPDAAALHAHMRQVIELIHTVTIRAAIHRA